MYSIFTEIFESQFTRKCKKNNLNIFIFPRIKSLNNNNWKQSSFWILMLYTVCTVMAFNLLGIFSSQKSKLSKKKIEGIKYRHYFESDFKIHLVCAIISFKLIKSNPPVFSWAKCWIIHILSFLPPTKYKVFT